MMSFSKRHTVKKTKRSDEKVTVSPHSDEKESPHTDQKVQTNIQEIVSAMPVSPSRISMQFLVKHCDLLCFFLFAVAGLVSRFYKISNGNKVIWDEAHFGKFASHYIKRTFYFDVHPPLGKMLLGLSGLMAGYNGTFAFESGHEYPKELNYNVMRMFCAFWGSLLVPIAYLTCRKVGMSVSGASTAAAMVMFDNALAVISRFILLDSMLLFFTALSFHQWARIVYAGHLRPFSIGWWGEFTLLGISLGLVSSVKWVGLFLVAVVGLYTIHTLWTMFGNLKISISVLAANFLARAVCLILVPILVYLACFKVHFAILNESGPGDSQMSSLFQANLQGNAMKNIPLEIAYGSKITLRNMGWGGGILHSHAHFYPYGSKQQQITCYHHRDQNNEFIVKPARLANDSIQQLQNQVEFLTHGSVVRLVHASTGRYMHSHRVSAPITKKHYEVSAYGDETFGDLNDNFVIEVVDDFHRGSKARKKGARIHALNTKVRLRHEQTGCVVGSTRTALPEWGYGQHEVVCDHSKNANDSRENYWNFEQHWNDKLPFANASDFQTSFIDDFVNLQVAMYNTNKGLVKDVTKEPDGLTSDPFEWPLLLHNIRMCGWGDSETKFLMIGNPIIWWNVAAAVAIFVFLALVRQIARQRSLFLFSSVFWTKFFFTGGWMCGAWALHYLPFFVMGRVLYLHHYFPALYFGILLSSFMLDSFIKNTKSIIRYSIYVAAVSVYASVFIHFSPLTYGYSEPSQQLAQSHMWINQWRVADQ